MVKSILQGAKTFRLGCNPSPAGAPKLYLGNYMRRGQLPPPPASYDYTSPHLASLKKMYANDQLGCCVIAGGCHTRGVTSGNAGSEVIFPDSDVIRMYSAIGGYVPGNSATDNGCDPSTAINYWVKHGFTDGLRLAGALTVDATDQLEVETALWLFENLFLAVALPDDWLGRSMPQGDGFVWDVAGWPNPNNGHLITAFGYNSQGVKICTWGMVGILTWNALRAYGTSRAGGELYTLLSPDMIIKAKNVAPNGFDWPSLIQDANSMGGNIPVPDPIPTPPNPVPPGPVPIPVVPPIWQALLQLIQHLLHTMGPLAVPIIEMWISRLPLPAAIIQAIDTYLEQFLGHKVNIKYLRHDP